MARPNGWRPMLDRVTAEISELWLDRFFWRSFRNMAQSVPVAHDSFILAWIGQQYYRRAAIAIRSMVDVHPDSDSLINLRADIRDHGSEMTCPGSCADLRAPGVQTADPAKVQADVDRLTTAAYGVRRYVNRHLAHIAREPKVPLPQITEVDDAVQLLGELARKYTLLIRDTDLEVEPKVLFDWTKALREPWVQLPPTGDCVLSWLI